MQRQDQTEEIDGQETTGQTPAEDGSVSAGAGQSADGAEAEALAGATDQPQRGFDWPALFVALGIAAFFAVIARFNSQPAPSFVPIAVLSATGCGLLITALHKLRGRTGIGLREAGLAGFGMALFQFAVAFTYPNVWTGVRTIPVLNQAFLTTWGLVGLFAIILSLVGASVGHLAFAPLRPLPAKPARPASSEEDEEVDENEEEQVTQHATNDKIASGEAAQAEQANAEDEDEEEEAEQLAVTTTSVRPRQALANYSIAVLLLGLLPMMAGYVFAAAYDLLMNALNINQIFPGLYPTLSLLSGLLPWRLPFSLLNTNGAFAIFTLLWRIPDSMIVNPNLFDVQSLEPLLFNAAALAFLLLTMYGSDHQQGKQKTAPWGAFLLLQALFGLILILPANLWLLRGLEGVLQLGNQVAQIPTIQLLNPTLFVLNLLTGVVFCLLVGLIVRRQYQLWTAPRPNTPEEETEVE